MTQASTYHHTADRPEGGNNKHFCTQTGRLERLEHGQERLESAQMSLIADVSEIRQTIGNAPSIDGKPGTGVAGVVYRMANQIMLGTPRGALESLSADGPGEITKVQSREELMARVKIAEAAAGVKALRDKRVIEYKHAKLKVIGSVLIALVSGGGLFALLQSCVGG